MGALSLALIGSQNKSPPWGSLRATPITLLNLQAILRLYRSLYEGFSDGVEEYMSTRPRKYMQKSGNICLLTKPLFTVSDQLVFSLPDRG
jgi:hypothetical protein